MVIICFLPVRWNAHERSFLRRLKIFSLKTVGIGIAAGRLAAGIGGGHQTGGRW